MIVNGIASGRSTFYEMVHPTHQRHAAEAAAAAAAAAAAEDAAPCAGADQDWYRRQLLSRLTEGLREQQEVPQVAAAVDAAGARRPVAAARPQHGSGAASSSDSNSANGASGVAGLRVLWQEQPALLADSSHRQLVVLHLGYDLQHPANAQQQPTQAQTQRYPGPADDALQRPHAQAAPDTAAGGGSGMGAGMMVRVLVFGHHQVLLDATVRLGPVLRWVAWRREEGEVEGLCGARHGTLLQLWPSYTTHGAGAVMCLGTGAAVAPSWKLVSALMPVAAAIVCWGASAGRNIYNNRPVCCPAARLQVVDAYRVHGPVSSGPPPAGASQRVDHPARLRCPAAHAPTAGLTRPCSR